MAPPPVPEDVDLRSFPHMQLDVAKLLNSDFMNTVSDAAYRAGSRLWCHAWHQVPASSVPSSDRVLAGLAGFGRDVEAWLAVKDEALMGFELCDDGRYYHGFIAAKALEAWGKRKAAVGSAKARWSGRKAEPRTTEPHEPSKPSRKPVDRGTRIPDDWQPDRDYARGKGLDDRTIDREAEKFRNFWRAKSGAGAIKLDWLATWQNWVMTAAQHQGERTQPPRGTHSNGKPRGRFDI